MFVISFNCETSIEAQTLRCNYGALILGVTDVYSWLMWVIDCIPFLTVTYEHMNNCNVYSSSVI